MWSPRQFLRNLFAFGFVALVLFTALEALLGSLVALALLFFGPISAAALCEGKTSAKTGGVIPSGAEAWSVARGMAETYLAVLVILSAIMAISFPDIRIWLARTNILTIAILYSTTTLVAFVSIRWCYTLGATMALEKRNSN
jgi:hypothetical protein